EEAKQVQQEDSSLPPKAESKRDTKAQPDAKQAQKDAAPLAPKAEAKTSSKPPADAKAAQTVAQAQPNAEIKAGGAQPAEAQLPGQKLRARRLLQRLLTLADERAPFSFAIEVIENDRTLTQLLAAKQFDVVAVLLGSGQLKKLLADKRDGS